ncbi:hypothetical protein CK1_36380 [Ruminococcus sp. SR1/5]|nr:hypothetical protein CK1_36380 [Ruminococcus sp. SR1/5]
MAYNRGERPDSPMKRRGGRRRKKFVYSAVKRITRSITRM